MGDEDAGAHGHDAQQHLGMLGLQHCKDHREAEHGDEQVVDHARADLIEETVAQEMDGADDAQQQHKDERYHQVLVKHLIVEQRVERGDRRYMTGQVLGVAHHQIVGAHKPIGRKQADDAGPKRAPAERHHVAPQHDPQEGHEEHNLDEGERGHAQTEKGIEHPARRLFVLVGLEQRHVEGDDAQLHNGALHVGERHRGHGRKHQEGARHHAAVDADEHIDVVELHHQIRRDDHAPEGHPHLPVDEHASCRPHQDGIYQGQWQCKLTLCYSVL